MARNLWGHNYFRGSCQYSRRNFVLKLYRIVETANKDPDFYKKIITGDE